MQRAGEINTWCGASDTQMKFVCVEASEADPTTGGCWVRTPTGCPEEGFNARQWTWDTWANNNGHGYTRSDCMGRKSDFDSWCGANDAHVATSDTEMFFVPHPPTPAPTSPPTPSDTYTSPGDGFYVMMHANWGNDHDVDHGVIFQDNSDYVEYKCWGTTLSPACAHQGGPTSGRYLCIENGGGYTMWFKIANQRLHAESAQTEDYPIGVRKCKDMKAVRR
jgi:hypothetical protein